MAGAYSSTYSKLQAQGQQLLHPSMQLALADAAAAASQDMLPSGDHSLRSCNNSAHTHVHSRSAHQCHQHMCAVDSLQAELALSCTLQADFEL